MYVASDPHFRWKLISLLYSKASVFIKVLHHMWLEEKNRSSQNNKNLILTDFNDFFHVSLSRLLVTLDTDKYSLKNNNFSIEKRRSNSF